MLNKISVGKALPHFILHVVGVVVTVGLGVATQMFLIEPKQKEIGKLEGEISALEGQISTARQNQRKVVKFEEVEKDRLAKDINSFSTLVPTESDDLAFRIQFDGQLQAFADASKNWESEKIVKVEQQLQRMTFGDFEVGDAEAVDTGEKKKKSNRIGQGAASGQGGGGAKTISPGANQRLIILPVVCPYWDIPKVLDMLLGQDRLVTINQVSIQRRDDVFPLVDVVVEFHIYFYFEEEEKAKKKS